MGDEAAKAIQDWATKEWPQQSRMQLEVRARLPSLRSAAHTKCSTAAPDEIRSMMVSMRMPWARQIIKAKDSQGTADALRAVSDKLTARTLVVMSGDLLTDFPVNALVAKHQVLRHWSDGGGIGQGARRSAEVSGVAGVACAVQMDGALATALLFRRKVSPTTETKPGKAPKVHTLRATLSAAPRAVPTEPWRWPCAIAERGLHWPGQQPRAPALLRQQPGHAQGAARAGQHGVALRLRHHCLGPGRRAPLRL